MSIEKEIADRRYQQIALQDERIKELEAERDQYKHNYICRRDAAVSANMNLAIACEALEFYADQENWSEATVVSTSRMKGDDYIPLMNDNFIAGKTAKEALEKIKPR